MPRELIAIGPSQPVLRDYAEPPLEPNQIRIKSRFSAEKHGTMLPGYKNQKTETERVWDPKVGLYVPRGVTRFPMRLGNMTVGIVIEVGSQVQEFKVRDRVYGYLPIRETHTVNEERVNLAPAELSDEELVCIDPAVVALMAIREGHIRLGDKVAIFGLGAIGLMAVQMAKLSGAMLIIGVEPIEKRRKLAETYGADLLFDPTDCDVGLEIREITDVKGVDISIEASGSYRALHQAIRAARYGGMIVPVSRYHGEVIGIDLYEDWHVNRQVMVAGARVESEPYRDYPLWDRKRIYETIIELLRKKAITVKGMLSPIAPFEESARAYRLIGEKPKETIKLGIIYH